MKLSDLKDWWKKKVTVFYWIQEGHYSDYIVSQIRKYLIKYCLENLWLSTCRTFLLIKKMHYFTWCLFLNSQYSGCSPLLCHYKQSLHCCTTFDIPHNSQSGGLWYPIGDSLILVSLGFSLTFLVISSSPLTELSPFTCVLNIDAFENSVL